jgi:hypothetical protein
MKCSVSLDFPAFRCTRPTVRAGIVLAYDNRELEREAGIMKATTTLLELVTAVTDEAESEAEVIATVVHLVNSGAVRLCGIFRDARIDLTGSATHPLFV